MSRPEAQKQVRLLGGVVHSSVSSRTTWVVCGDSPGSKAKKARTLHVPIMNEQQFLDHIKKT